MLALLLGAFYAVARRLRNVAFFTARGRIVTVIETTVLTPQVSLHVVRAGRRRLLVSAGVQSARTLAHWLADDDPSDVKVAELREFVAGGLD